MAGRSVALRWGSIIVLALLASVACAGAPAVDVTPAATSARPAGHVAGDRWTRPTDGAMMVYVPAGAFQMGNDDAGIEYGMSLCRQYSVDAAMARASCRRAAFADEGPAHAVTLSAFWVDLTEATNGRYRQCVTAGACRPPADVASYTRAAYYGAPEFDAYPVVWVTQQQAAEYCAWAGGRLPTEAEWEYAARGPAALRYPWGNDFDGARLNYCAADCAAAPNDASFSDGYPETAPVGVFPAGVSWCGALDLGGNVREWVADWYGASAATPQTDPPGPASGESRISRGGAWMDTPDDARSANRGANTPDYTRDKVGFRCAVSASR